MDTFRPRLASPTVGPSYTIMHWVQSPTIGPTTGCPLLGILIGLSDPVYWVVRGKNPTIAVDIGVCANLAPSNAGNMLARKG